MPSSCLSSAGFQKQFSQGWGEAKFLNGKKFTNFYDHYVMGEKPHRLEWQHLLHNHQQLCDG